MTTEDVVVIKNTESGGRGRNLPIGVVLTPTIFFASFLLLTDEHGTCTTARACGRGGVLMY